MSEQNVYQYFNTYVGENPRDKTLLDLPVASPCGQDCVKAIDEAQPLLKRLRDESYIRPMLVDVLNEIVELYWRG